MSGICAGIALHIMIKNTLNRLRREIQAGGFSFIPEQAPGVMFKPQPGKNFSY